MRTHIRRSAEQWQVLIDEQSESGLSAPQFCNQRLPNLTILNGL